MLTAAGRDLQDVAERVEAEVHGAENRVLGRDGQLEGGLRVSSLDFLFMALQPSITAFVRRYPGVELTMIATDAEVSLSRRDAEVALRLSDRPLDYLVGRRVGRLEFAVYGSKDLVFTVGAKAPLGEYPWLH